MGYKKLRRFVSFKFFEFIKFMNFPDFFLYSKMECFFTFFALQFLKVLSKCNDKKKWISILPLFFASSPPRRGAKKWAEASPRRSGPKAGDRVDKRKSTFFIFFICSVWIIPKILVWKKKVYWVWYHCLSQFFSLLKKRETLFFYEKMNNDKIYYETRHKRDGKKWQLF